LKKTADFHVQEKFADFCFVCTKMFWLAPLALLSTGLPRETHRSLANYITYSVHHVPFFSVL